GRLPRAGPASVTTPSPESHAAVMAGWLHPWHEFNARRRPCDRSVRHALAHTVDIRPAPGHARLQGGFPARFPGTERVRYALPGGRYRGRLATAQALALAARP